MTLKTITAKNYTYFSVSGKTGSKCIRRKAQRGKPVYETAKFPSAKKDDVVEVSVNKTDYVAKAYTTLIG